MRISIAMATYNGEDYLQDQLDSFLCQTCLPDELVVCDDGSTDTTVEILEAACAEAPFVIRIYRNQKNLGYKKNFEKVVSLCKGDIVFLSDQDDVWFRNKIEKVMGVFERCPDKWVVVNNAEIVDANLSPTGLTVQGQLQTAGLHVEQLLLGCCMALRSVIKPVFLPVPDHLHGHDGWLNELANVLDCRMSLADVCQLYRRHGENTSESPTTLKSRATKGGLLLEKLQWKNLKVNPLVASDRRIERLDVLLERLRVHEDYLAGALPSIVVLNEALKTLEQERDLNVRRRGIQRQSLISRVASALKFFFSGGYRFFEGWKSLLRDVLR